ncbi:phosphoribosylglycinamide synthetase [Petrocella atlantisensis]|uniref:Phosphoribosylamine--glycine ligase n=1 Tax=Petrocella atlantisensis TaxID=2173034 RepID=A0A3P7RUJ4_9FIRM|nr:phosphoribosylamine--glycine ligase [Petrocella atlantisensis]VDN46452.1 phosphoribosylglycinamide synthetase [Petrocella atlantisensis]
MKVLVIGGGGREHAIVWKLAQSKKVTEIYCAPGNAGIMEMASCVDISATDVKGLLEFALEKAIDLTVVGMDDPLMLGVVDIFASNGLRIFGPRKNAAILEGSKVFAKDLMKKYNIPTAGYEVFENPDQAKAYLKTCSYPTVLKADGLALGKGVLICETQEEALAGVDEIMIAQKFGDAGKVMVVEEFMTGPEVSVLSFCDGEHVLPMVSAQDHKRAFDNDEGPNTGGMGTFSPSRYYTKEMHEVAMKTIFEPSLKAMKAEGRSFTGIIFFGLMLTPQGIKVLEYNARFGDPEAQVVLPKLKTDLFDVLEAAIDGRLDEIELKWDNRPTVCVVMASGGYPIAYEKGYTITGLEKQKKKDDVVVFHAGTKKEGDRVVTNGGRVLGVTAFGDSMEDARKTAYKAVSEIEFENKQYRTDIGIK